MLNTNMFLFQRFLFKYGYLESKIPRKIRSAEQQNVEPRENARIQAREQEREQALRFVLYALCLILTAR